MSVYPSVPGFFVFIISLLLSLALGSALPQLFSHMGIPMKLRYRLAVISASAIGLAFSLFLNRGGSLLPGLVGSVAGGVAGAALVSWRLTTLSENNLAPSPEICQQVLDGHRLYSGTTAPAPSTKRIFDVILAVIGLIITFPLFLLIAFLVWWEDPGPVILIKNSVTLGGANFHQYKFRTMIQNAEKESGPILAEKRDLRVLRTGHFLRKTALDELPQLWNIFRGDMSFVGPRPQRTVLVFEYLRDLPAYAERHGVRPGLSGLAQVVGHYYLTPLQKLRFDRVYIRNSSLRFDFLLLVMAVCIVAWWRWTPEWEGRITPRYRRWIKKRRDESRINRVLSPLNRVTVSRAVHEPRK